MILQISELIYSYLKAFNDANDNAFGGCIYPLIAVIGATDPFCVYRITKRPCLTKDKLFDVFVEIAIGGANHDKLAGLADAVEEHFEQYNEFYYVGTDAGVEPDNPEQINITIKYNLKMQK